MTAQLEIKIDAAEVQKFLTTAPAKLERILQNVIYKAALLVERHAKQGTPVDTGRLRASISSTIAPMKATVAPHTNYAVYVHDGTKYMQGRPFMTRAKETLDAQMRGLVEDELKTLQ